MSNKDKAMDPRVRKHRFLEQYNAVKKDPSIALILGVIGGFWGAHRLYLGQKTQALIIAAIWLVLVIFFSFNRIVALVWGFGDIIMWLWMQVAQFMNMNDVLGVVREYGNNSVAEKFVTNRFMGLVSYLPVLAFGGFVIFDSFRARRAVEKYNDDQKARIEAELG